MIRPWVLGGGQRPVFKTNVTRFTSLREVQPQVDKRILRKICHYFKNEDTQLRLDPSFEPTNAKNVEHKIIEPYAPEEHTAIFYDLQKLESIGLVIPIGEEHMYFAAMNSKSCGLTAVGKQYWKLVKQNKI